MRLNLYGLDPDVEENYRHQSHPDYLDVASIRPDYFDVPTNGKPRPTTDECQCVAPEFPYYRCTRYWRHEGDHAAHGGHKGQGGHGIKMFARWARGAGDESSRLTREQKNRGDGK